jgi:hypothetical protein
MEGIEYYDSNRDEWSSGKTYSKSKTFAIDEEINLPACH